MEKRVEITITKLGETSVEAFGYVDGRCRDATRDFENDLGSWEVRTLKNMEQEEREKVKT